MSERENHQADESTLLAAKEKLASVPYDMIQSVAARLRRARQAPPTPKVLRPCQFCGSEFGARELREHTPSCPRKPAAVSSVEPPEHSRRALPIAPLGLGVKKPTWR
jgi:hypothetical protein